MSKFITPSNIYGNFYGGLPYNVSWNFNDGTSPSTLTVSVVNNDGVYQDPTNSLGYANSTSVQIGSFTFNGYLVEYNIDKTPEQKLLNLIYTDLSADLDRYYVGLHTKYGDKNGTNGNRLIVVGKQYHPCDTVMDSSVEYAGVGGIQLDPCDPCPFMPFNKYSAACDPVRSEFQIFEVYYTFNELLDKLPFQNIEGAPKDNTFRSQHTGKLKDVLNAWCTDLGYAYYWDPFVGSLVFIDRKQPLTIPDFSDAQSSIPDIIDLKYGASVKNTFSRGFIGYFSKQGEIKDYTCTMDPAYSFINTQCLTLTDLGLGKEWNGSFNGYTALQTQEIECALAYYNKSLRDAFLWFSFYAINSDKDADDLIGDYLTRFGGFKILDVYSEQLTPAKFVRCKSLYSYTELAAMNPDAKKPDPYYFIVAEDNPEMAEKQWSDTTNLANNFLGKFWFKRYNTPIPGGDNSHTQISIDTPDGGNGQWYFGGSNLSSLPIFGFGDQPDSKVGKLRNLFVDDSKNNQNPMTAFSPSNGSPPAGGTIRGADAFILAQRDAKWYPSLDDASDYDSLYKFYEDLVPKTVRTDGRMPLLYELYPDAKINKNIRLYRVGIYKKMPVSISSIQHPLEHKSMTPKTKTEEDAFGNSTTRTLGSYGLISSNAINIVIGGLSIIVPTQAFGTAGGGLSDSSAGYTVYAQAAQSFKKVLPKIEKVIQLPAPETNVAQIDYHFKEIREDNLDVVRGAPQCFPEDKEIADYVQSIGENSYYSMAQPQKMASFKVPGVFTHSYKVSDGLTSVQISSNDKGVFTTYTFEDRVIIPPGDDYVLQNLKDKTIQRGTLASSQVGSLDMNMVGRSFGKNF